MHFSKIKYSEAAKKLSLEWEETKPSGDAIAHSLTSTDAPRPEFLAALAALAPFVVTICDFGEWGDSLRATGVAISEKDDARAVVITATRALELTSAPLAINTPHLIEDNWPDGLADALETLEREATLFVKGKRAQQELFEKNGKAEGAGEEDGSPVRVDDDQVQEVRAAAEAEV